MKRDVETVNMTGIFLKTEADNDEEIVIIKLAGAVTLLLVEMDEKWINNFHILNRNWIACATCYKAIHRKKSTFLMACKNLARSLKEWGFEMNLYDSYV